MRKVIFYFIVCISFSLFLTGCEKESGPVDPNDPNPPGSGATKSFTSTDNGSFDYDGFSIVIKSETVPRLQSGQTVRKRYY
jgi:hypothetical protein